MSDGRQSLNVLLVCAWDNLGGVSSVVNQVAGSLIANGHRAYLLNPGDSNFPSETTSRKGFPAYHMRLRRVTPGGATLRAWVSLIVAMPMTLFALARLIRRLRIDVVNIHYPTPPQFYFAVLRRLGFSKLLVSVHGADLLPNGVRDPAAQRGVRALLAAGDMLVVPSETYRKCVLEAWPEIRQKRIDVIANGVNPTELGYDPVSPQQPDQNPPFILSIVNLVHYKGVDILIRAFAGLAGRFPGLRLKLISGGPDRRDFEQLAADLGVGDRVDFLGFQEKPVVADHLRRCTLFVLPSRSNSESFGISAAEAMAVDRPVVASRVGGLPELIDHGKTGLLVQPGDATALQTAIERLLDDPDLRQRFGKASGARIRRELLWEKTGRSYEQVFRKMTGTEHAATMIPDSVPTTIIGGTQDTSRQNQHS